MIAPAAVECVVFPLTRLCATRLRRLNMSAAELRSIETLTLNPRSVAGLEGEDDEETYKLVGVKIMSGPGSERVVVMSAASGDEVVLLRAEHGLRASFILDSAEWRVFQADLRSDPRAETLKRASLVLRHLLPHVYDDEPAEDNVNSTNASALGPGAHNRRLAIRRRLHCSLNHWPSEIFSHCASAAGNALASISRTISDIGGWLAGGFLSGFTTAYDRVTGFISNVRNMILNWMDTVRNWIRDRLRALMSMAGPQIASIINSALAFLDNTILDRLSMNANDQTEFLNDVGSPLSNMWTANPPLIGR